MTIFRLAITPGEPAGIGYDLAVILAQKQQTHELVVFGDVQTLTQRAAQLNLPLSLKTISLNAEPQALKKGELGVVPIAVSSPVVAGQLNTDNAGFVLQCLDQAIAACQQKTCHAMITGPVQKKCD